MKRRSIAIILLTCIFISCEKPDEQYDEGFGGSFRSFLPTYYGNPAWHPDGNWIAADHGDSLDTNGDGKMDDHFQGIWLIHSKTGTKQTLLKGFSYPSWSPDGKFLAMHGRGQIFTIKIAQLMPALIDSTTLRQTTFDGANFFPSWSPDGQWIAYDSNKNSPSGMYFLWKMKSDGSGKTRISYEPTIGEIRQPNWSANNNYIVHYRYGYAIGGHPEIFIMNADGDSAQQLTFLNSWTVSPRFSPSNGGKIIFQHSPPGKYPSILITNSDGTGQQVLIKAPALQPAWSPNGRRIVFLRHHLHDRISGNGHLWIYDIIQSGMVQLTFD